MYRGVPVTIDGPTRVIPLFYEPGSEGFEGQLPLASLEECA